MSGRIEREGANFPVPHEKPKEKPKSDLSKQINPQDKKKEVDSLKKSVGLPEKEEMHGTQRKVNSFFKKHVGGQQ